MSLATLRNKYYNLWGNSKKIGLAVSGGVDSMAMAALARREYDGEIHAFTVDHRARHDSTAEALEVKKNLAKIGIDNHHILTIKKNLPVQKFELVARLERHKLLKAACHDQEITHLLLAHNLNDQHETFIMRLLKGSSAWGLAGTMPIDMADVLRKPSDENLGSAVSPSQIDTSLWYVRPLIDVSKQTLIDYCRSNSVPWVEDPTNLDPSLTMRNTIRQLFRREKDLPQALRPYSLTQTLSKLQQSRIQMEQEARDLVKYMETHHHAHILEGAGVVKIHEIPEFTSLTRSKRALVLSLLCRRIAPGSLAYDLSKFDNLAHQLATDRPTHEKAMKTHYASKLRFDMVPDKNYTKTNRCIYTVTRQKARRSNILDYSTVSVAQDRKWTKWHLVDGRFWVRLRSQNEAETNLQISYRLLHNDNDARRALMAKIGLKSLSLPHKFVVSQPFFTIHNDLDPYSLRPSQIIGYPTLGLYDRSVVEIQTQLKEFNGSCQF